MPNEKKASEVHCKLRGKHVKFSGNTTSLRVHLHDTHAGVYSALLQAEKEKTTTSKAHTEAQQPTLAQVKFIVILSITIRYTNIAQLQSQ